MSADTMSVDTGLVVALTAQLDAESLPRLGRSLVLFPVAAGVCGGCALEFAMLRSVAYGLAQHGVTVAEHPSGADVLLISGAMTRDLVRPVQSALAAMARPRWVVAVGDCAADGGLFAGAGPVLGGAAAAVPVDLVVPGCPPTPAAMLAALRTLLAVNLG